jgi:hypothetical protein
MGQQPQGIVSHVYHDVDFEVSKVVSPNAV